MSRPPKPSGLKVITGSRQPHRSAVVAFPRVDVPPPAPDWLSPEAAKEWTKLAPLLAASGLLNEGTVGAFGVLCSLHADIVRAWVAGTVPRSGLLTQYRLLAADFALTPVAQSRIAEAAAATAGNRFADNGRRPATRKPNP